MEDLYDGRDELAPRPARLRARDLYDLDSIADAQLATDEADE